MIITGDDFDGIVYLQTALSHRFARKIWVCCVTFWVLRLLLLPKVIFCLGLSILLTYLSMLGLLTTRLLILLLKQV